AALEKLQIVDNQNVDSSNRFLKRQGGLAAQRRDKAVHETLGGQVKHLAVAGAVARPRDRLEQMGFAPSDRGMDVQRVDVKLFAALAGGGLFRRGVRTRVGAADDEGFEAQPRIEW